MQDEAVSLSNTITESHEVKVQDLAKKHEGEVQQYKGDLVSRMLSNQEIMLHMCRQRVLLLKRLAKKS